jgi:hypothetical protein
MAATRTPYFTVEAPPSFIKTNVAPAIGEFSAYLMKKNYISMAFYSTYLYLELFSMRLPSHYF